MVELPGFVDSHTHLPFAGTKEKEFVLGLKGDTYQQLAEKGLGIKTTVRATKAASKKELLSLCISRLDSMLLHGTHGRSQSGYGLSLKDEIKEFLLTSLVSSFDAQICASIFLISGTKNYKFFGFSQELKSF